MTTKQRQPAAAPCGNLRPHYSGGLSRRFWDLVQTVNRRSPEQDIHALTCTLQTLEETTLARIRAAFEKATRK